MCIYILQQSVKRLSSLAWSDRAQRDTQENVIVDTVFHGTPP